jgi:diguanylate cyclase (GGDEF)-like protein
MYAVISGELEVVDTLDQGGEDQKPQLWKRINTLGPGDTVGEMGMIRSCRRSATVIAARPSELLQINDRMIHRLQWLFPPTAQKFFFNLMGAVCNRLESLTTCYLEASILDPVTGLPSRDYFMQSLETEIARAKRYHIPFGLFVLQLDNLMDINRAYGYPAGDVVVVETARLLKAQLRRTDILCRLGGSRFAILFGHIEEQTATVACERFRRALLQHGFRYDSLPLSVVTSDSLTLFDPESQETAADLVQKAHRTLGKGP